MFAYELTPGLRPFRRINTVSVVGIFFLRQLLDGEGNYVRFGHAHRLDQVKKLFTRFRRKIHEHRLWFLEEKSSFWPGVHRLP